MSNDSVTSTTRAHQGPIRRKLRLAGCALALAAVAAPSSSQAATAKPSWCPSLLTSGVAVEFGANRIVPSAPIEGTVRYSFVNINAKPTAFRVDWAESWSKSASITVSVGGEFGFSPISSVKVNVDSSIASSISSSRGYSQSITLPPQKRAKVWYSVDLRETSLRYVQYGIKCRATKFSPWTTVRAPRSGTVKPQVAIVS